ncbi:MAG: protein adenylyltransferase SelO, partial [Steroidobacteraceae bacterium]
APPPVREPALAIFNAGLAAEMGIDASDLDEVQLAAYCAGNRIPEGAQPVALAYAGHQFGNFVPTLGDGRALLMGELVDVHGRRRDLQWKGSGRTPFSRGGDGRSALGPVLREYLVSEAMHALGLPTSRALSATLTGEQVLREEPLPGGVLIRVAASHVRIGTFEYFAVRGALESLRQLVAYVIHRHDPELAEEACPALKLLTMVGKRQASLVAGWMSIGFIHGVMNTDNMSISGETIDFGPCAFMDEYDPATVYSYIDRRGRYAYGNQPAVLQWNLARLAEALLPLIHDQPEEAVAMATEALGQVPGWYREAWQGRLRGKLGLVGAEPDDHELAEALLRLMHAEQADFTNTFRALSGVAAGVAVLPPAFDSWRRDWQVRLARDQREGLPDRLRAANPAFIPRNHQVDKALEAAVREGNLAPFRRLHEVLQRPFEDQPEAAHYADPPRVEERIGHTFCGT